MDGGLLWTVVGSVTGVAALGLTAWQVRLQLLERRERRQDYAPAGQGPELAAGGLPVTVPLGRLPAEVRGRDLLLAELRAPVARRHPGGAERVWVLAGMGGVGKSTAALAAAKTARAAGWQVWWITATDAASLTGGMLEVLGQLGAPESVTRPVREGAPTAADRTWEFLNGPHPAGRRWLMILDNADRPAALAGHGADCPADYSGWLRPDPSGMVIVTTRHKDPKTWGPGLVLRELAPLDEATSARVLGDLATDIVDSTGEEAKDLGRRLGGLPLALHLAGTYLSSPFARWHSFADYHHALDGVELPDALADIDDPASHARGAIQRTWDLSLDALATDGRAQARPLLLLLSCYAPATPIPAWFLRADLLAKLLSPRTQDAGSSGDGPHRWLRDGLTGLAVIGLIDITRGNDDARASVVTVHPVVADANRSRLLTTMQSGLPDIGQAAVRLLHAAAEQLASARPADWPAWHQIVPHLAALLGWLAAHLDTEDLTSLLHISDTAADALRCSGNPAAAETLARSSVAAAVRLGQDHPASLIARQRLGQAIGQQGRNSEAEQIYRQLLPAQQRVLGNKHPSTLSTRHDLAEQMFRELATDQQAALGDQHPDTLTTRNLLARVIGLQGRHAEAEQMCRQILAGRQQILGDDHPETLHTRHNLAWMIGLQGRYAETEQLCRQLLADRQRILGDGHPATLTTRLRLARAVLEQDRYAEAEELCRQVLADRQRILGDGHPATLTARNLLARPIVLQGRYAEAEQLYRRVLADRQQLLGNNHPDTMVTRNNLGWMLGLQGQYEQAAEILVQVLTDRRQILGDTHPDTLKTYHWLAQVAAGQGRYQEAERLYRHTVTARQQILGDNHPDTVAARRGLAQLTQLHSEAAENSRLTSRPPS
jgi:tetratricopeptide (TPR) repeat protein